MKTRALSAIGIVLVSIVPALFGGWVFAATMAIIFALAWIELLPLANVKDVVTRNLGVAIILLAAISALLWPVSRGLPLLVTIMLLIPMAMIILPSSGEIELGDWATRVGAIAYLALPAYAAVSLRQIAGNADSQWFTNLNNAMPGAGNTALGLGWFTLALFITWMSDTFAYLVGKSVGRTKLIPRVSPNKTVEGAIGGFLAAGITALLVVKLFGLPLNLVTAFILGVGLGVIGLIGDLFESQLKRRAGVKDSGNTIPGHGGFLDRIDAFIWVILVTFVFIPFLN